MEVKVTVNNDGGTVTAYEEGIQVGQLDFVFMQGDLSIEHTRTFKGHEGKGVAGALVQAATDYVVDHNLKVRPLVRASSAIQWHAGVMRCGKCI